MKKKFIFSLLFFSLLVGCGSSEEPKNPTTDDPTPVDPQPQEEHKCNHICDICFKCTDLTCNNDVCKDKCQGHQPEVKEYTITFKDEEGKTLESKKYDEGTIPSYTYEKQDTAEYDYTFEGWSKTLGGEISQLDPATKDATYYAIVSKERIQFDIIFKDENGNQISTQKVAKGVIPNYIYNVDSKDTDTYDYTFEGWSKTLGGEISQLDPATKDATYYAIVSKVRILFDITFKDENGQTLSIQKVSVNTVPSYTYEKQDTAEYDYTFEGWSNTLGGDKIDLPIATKDTTYYAVVSKVKKQYTLSFEENGGSEVEDIKVEYGSEINEPSTKPKLDDYVFVAWTYDLEGKNSVTWPITLTSNTTLYAQYNEKVDVVGIIKQALKFDEFNPYTYIPESMQAKSNITSSQATYNFENDVNVDDIKYGGHGEQWHMVLENIAESQRFYNVLTTSETLINASVILFNNFFDNNPSATSGSVSGSEDSKGFKAYIDCSATTLNYSLVLQTGWTIPLLGEIKPQIDVVYNIVTFERFVRIQLTSENVIAYHISSEGYTFGLKYGTSAVSRKAYCQMNKDDNDNVQGHIYEFVQAVGKDLVPSCCDFYITEEYTSCVGNKADGLIGFEDTIAELYLTSDGKLLGYEIEEAKEKITYNTLWFNLDNVSGINSIKAIPNSNLGVLGNGNQHDVYINGSKNILSMPRNISISPPDASRKFDIEIRKQYFYEETTDGLLTHCCEIPMLFVQERNLETFTEDMENKNDVISSITLGNTIITKIESYYYALVPVFKTNKTKVTADTINTFIESAITLD